VITTAPGAPGIRSPAPGAAVHRKANAVHTTNTTRTRRAMAARLRLCEDIAADAEVPAHRRRSARAEADRIRLALAGVERLPDRLCRFAAP
jgi:hypothetical protein